MNIARSVGYTIVTLMLGASMLAMLSDTGAFQRGLMSFGMQPIGSIAKEAAADREARAAAAQQAQATGSGSLSSTRPAYAQNGERHSKRWLGQPAPTRTGYASL